MIGQTIDVLLRHCSGISLSSNTVSISCPPPLSLLPRRVFVGFVIAVRVLHTGARICTSVHVCVWTCARVRVCV
jgi:hypothetical protein